MSINQQTRILSIDTKTNKKKEVKMRHKRLKLSVILLLGFGLTGVKAQTMYVKESNGTQTTYALSNIQKLSFSTGNLTVAKKDMSTGVYALSDLRYLNFSDNTTSLDKPLSVENRMLSVYPNPASDLLYIDLTGTVQERGKLSIINIEGKTVLIRQVNDKEVISLDISHLPKGIYLCHYTDFTEVRTIKIIKQ